MATQKLIAIVGPTSSGKSDLAMKVAEELGGEIICADSRTIYEGMDIGTAKPSLDDRSKVVHHCLDLLTPEQSYSAGQFKRDAIGAIETIRKRGKIPIITGGTGLYAYSVIYDYEFPAGPNNKLRQELNELDINDLRERLRVIDEEAYESIDINNPRRLIRAIETVGMPRQKAVELPDDIVLVGIFPGLDILSQRIEQRTRLMISEGLVEEVHQLLKSYPAATEALQSIGYKEVVDYIISDGNIDDTVKLINLHTRQLAKRQMTWFKRNKDIVWFEDSAKALEHIVSQTKTRL